MSRASAWACSNSYAEQLVKAGKAYYCFCTEERLNGLHEAQKKARGREMITTPLPATCPGRKLPPSMAAGEPYVIRQKIRTERRDRL